MQEPPEFDPIPSLLSSDCESSLNPEAEVAVEDRVESPKTLENQAAEPGEPDSPSVPEGDGQNESSTSRKESDATDPETPPIDDECAELVQSGEPQSPSAKGQANSKKEMNKKKEAEQKQIVEHPATSLSLSESLRKKKR